MMTDQSEQKILVVTHEECLIALMELLTSPPPSQFDMDPSKSPIESMRVMDQVEVRGHLCNTAFAALRVEWEEREGEMKPRGVLESWGLTKHLDE